MLHRLLVLFLFFKPVQLEISASSDLNCDFTTTCRWRNSSNVGSGHFDISQLVEVDSQTKIMPFDENNPSPFIYTAGLMGRTLALLVSEVITCQLGGASIKYWYFKTGVESELEVCIRQPPGNQDIHSMRCYDGVSSTFGKQWIFRAVELPPIAQPFEIVFKTIFNPPTDIIALDDIRFEATLCESSNHGSSEGAGGGFDEVFDNFALKNQISQLDDFNGNDLKIDSSQFEAVSFAIPTKPVHHGITTTKTFGKKSSEANVFGGPRTGPLFASICPLVDCNFDENTFCNYVTSSTNSSSNNELNLKKWILSNRSVLNSLTGIPTDLSKNGYFIYAGGASSSSDETFILSTNHPVLINEPARLDFFVYQAGIRGKLRVCIDDDENCPISLDGRNIDINSQKWKNYYFDVSPGEHNFHFIADDFYENYAIGLDNIQLLNRFGTKALACSS